MWVLIIVLLTSSNWASTAQTLSVDFKSLETCTAAKEHLLHNLKSQNITSVISCEKL